MCEQYGGYPSQWRNEDFDDAMILFEIQNIIHKVQKREIEKEKKKRKSRMPRLRGKRR